MSELFQALQSELRACPQIEGLSPADMLQLAPFLQQVVNMVTRRRSMSLPEIEAELELASLEAERLVNALLEKGLVEACQVDRETHYKTRFAPRRKRVRSVDIWDAL